MKYCHTQLTELLLFFIAEEETQNSSLKLYMFLLLSNYVKYKAIITWNKSM